MCVAETVLCGLVYYFPLFILCGIYRDAVRGIQSL